MSNQEPVSRRFFVSGVTTALGVLALAPEKLLYGQGRAAAAVAQAGAQQPAVPMTLAQTMVEYDGFAKIANNENPYGPPASVLKAMNDVWRYSNRYGYPDSGLVNEIAKLHGVKPENVMIAAGSGEILDIVGSAFLAGEKKVVGAEVTYNAVYQHATAVKGAPIAVPLRADYGPDIPATIRATKLHYRDVGFVYLCNPNNPTGKIVTKKEVKELLDGIPDDMVVLIDEAYHHFVDNSDYASSTPYVIEGRPVIVARTFSKIAALAGMRLGYAIAPTDLIAKMRPYGTGTINALVKYGGVAALQDTDSQAQVKRVTLDLRKKTVTKLAAMGYDTIPSEANFFMVHIKRPVSPVIDAFKKRGVLVGRPFPPMTEHLRVSVGNADEMDRFTKAFKEIFVDVQQPAAVGGRGGAPRR